MAVAAPITSRVRGHAFEAILNQPPLKFLSPRDQKGDDQTHSRTWIFWG